MGSNSKIGWTHNTWNPWIGCAKVSAGCRFCYAEDMMDKRYGTAKWGLHADRVRTSDANWRKPFIWNKQLERGLVHYCDSCNKRTVFKNKTKKGHPFCKECGGQLIQVKRERVFSSSLADIFESKPNQPELKKWRDEALNVMAQTHNLDWLVLTKRPENVVEMIETASTHSFSDAEMWFYNYPHVWIGTSVENQATANKRIPELIKIPSKRFLSVEPLIGAVTLEGYCYGNQNGLFYHHDWLTGEKWEWSNIYGGSSVWDKGDEKSEDDNPYIHWVIVGGESGSKSRPFDIKWAQEIVAECDWADTPVFVKQMGDNAVQNGEKVNMGRKGGDARLWPSDIQRQEFPIFR